jgi:hypothetical protein
MKIHFEDSFFESLKTLERQQTWWYRIYATIRWDIPHFFKNIYRFRKELYEHQWWDYRFTLNMMQRSLEIMEEKISVKGIEVSESREPKVRQMRRAIELLKNSRRDSFIERAEAELGELQNLHWFTPDARENTPEEDEHNKKVLLRAQEIESDEWKELWSIFRGTNSPGTDMRGWWD